MTWRLAVLHRKGYNSNNSGVLHGDGRLFYFGVLTMRYTKLGLAKKETQD